MLHLYFIAILFSTISSTRSECGGPIMCPVGTPCNTTENSILCTENAFCDTDKNECTCKSGFMRTSYDFCLPSYQTNCSHYQCNEETQLVCDEDTNLCKCVLLDTHFSIPQQKCVVNAGKGCSQALGCTDNAFCNNEVDWNCYCGGGFSETAKGRCLLGFERNCNSSVGQDDDDAYLHACNGDVFLICDKEKCVCPTDTIYDERREECVSLVDEKCDFKVTADQERVLKCVDGAVCKNNGEHGICKCSKQSNFNQQTRTCDNGVGRIFNSTVKITMCVAALIAMLSTEFFN